MLDIIIAYFASLGIIFLIFWLLDYFSIHRFNVPILIDLSKSDISEINDIISSINAIRSLKSGRLLSDNITFCFDEELFNNEISDNKFLYDSFKAYRFILKKHSEN